MQPTASRPDRALIAIISVIVAIVLIAVAVILTRGGPADLDPASPEGVVQAYSNAVISDDEPTALALLTSDVRKNCERTHYGKIQGFVMAIESTKIHGNRAIVRVSVEHSYGDGLYGGSTYVSDERFDLVLEDDLWKVESSPWDLMLCFNQGAGNQ